MHGAELADKRRTLIVAVAFGLPLFLLAMARDFGLIAPWLTPFWAARIAVASSGAFSWVLLRLRPVFFVVMVVDPCNRRRWLRRAVRR